MNSYCKKNVTHIILKKNLRRHKDAHFFPLLTKIVFMKYYKQDIQSQPSNFITENDEMNTEVNKKISF